MKRLTLLLLLVAATLTSCKKDAPDVPATPKASFTDATFDVPKGCTKQIRLILEKPVTKATVFPVTFSGTAVLDTDYTTDVKEFTVAEGQKEAVLNVTIPFAITESKTVILTLGTIPAGYVAGRFTTTKITSTLSTTTIFSFANAIENMYATELPIEVNLKNQQGAGFNVAEATQIAIKVDPSSTAVLGVNFKFKDDKNYAEIRKGRNKGPVTIQLLKWEAGKDKIVLACGETNGYFDGTNPTATVNIANPIKNQIVGQWKGLSFYKLDGLANGWGLSAEQKALIPNTDSSDVIEFKADGTLVATNIQGKLKNYFRDCTYTVTGEVGQATLSNELPPERPWLPIIKLSKVNFNFSAKTEDIQTKNIYAFISSTAEHSEILTLQIFEYENTEPTEHSFIYNDALTYQFIRK